MEVSTFVAASLKYNKYFEFISIWYPFGKENIEDVLKGEANLRRTLDEPSVYHIQAYQSDLLLLSNLVRKLQLKALFCRMRQH